MAQKRPRLTLTVPEREARRRKIRLGLIGAVLFFLVVGPLLVTLIKQAREVTVGDIGTVASEFSRELVDEIGLLVQTNLDRLTGSTDGPTRLTESVLPEEGAVPEPVAQTQYPTDITTRPAEKAAPPSLPNMAEIAELPSRPSAELGGVVVNDDLPRWRQLAAPSPVSPGRPRIAIVMDDMGLSQSRSSRAADLPGPMTMSFLPYGDNLQEQVDLVRNKGHEVFLHLPMEPDTSDYPGPNALLVGLSEEELFRRLQWNMTRFRGFVGVNNHMGSRFTMDRAGMALLLKELNRSGLIFLDSKTSKDTVGYGMASERGMPSLIRDIFIDHVIEAEAIQDRLREVEEIAREQGYAIAICHPHSVTMDELAKWGATLADKGFTLVPVSNLLITPISG